MSDENDKKSEGEEGGEALTPEEKIAQLEEKIKNLESKTESMTEARKTINKEKREKETLEERMARLEEERKQDMEVTESSIKETKESIFTKLADNDAEREALQTNYDLLNMPENTPAQIEAKAIKAASMTSASSDTSPIYTGVPGSGAEIDFSSPNEKEYAFSEQGVGFAKQLGMSYPGKLKKK